jgi:hypothetical protein
LTLPEGTVFDYWKFSSVEELHQARVCSRSLSPACEREKQIYTAKLFDAHELIHAYVDGSAPPWIFVEGLADVLTCAYGPWSRPRDYANFDEVSALSWTDLVSWQPSGADGDLTYYRAATQLVRYLIDRFGVEPVMSYYRRALFSSDPAIVEEDFSASFEQSLAQAWSDALEIDLPGGPCLTPFECSHELLALGENLRVDHTCGVGYRYRTLELAVPSSFVAEAQGVADWRFERDSHDMLIACDGLNGFPYWSSGSAGPLATRLASGSYALIVPMPADTLQVTLMPGGVTDSCEAVEAQAVPLPQGGLIVALPETGDTWHVGFTVMAPQMVDLYGSGSGSGVKEVCSSCSDLNDCTALTGSLEPFSVSSEAVLKVPTEQRDGNYAIFNVTPSR